MSCYLPRKSISCFHQWALKPVIYQHLHADGLKLFTLVKGDLGGWIIPMSWKRPWDSLTNTRRRSTNRTSEWSFKCALRRGRSQGPPVHTILTGKRRRTAEHTPCWNRRDRRAHYEMKVRANQRVFTHTGKYKMCAHTGHMTFVPVTFASGDNEPACLFPTSLVLFSFFLPNKDSSDHGGVQTRRGWVKKNFFFLKINGSMLEEDKTLLGFNYFPL